MRSCSSVCFIGILTYSWLIFTTVEEKLMHKFDFNNIRVKFIKSRPKEQYMYNLNHKISSFQLENLSFDRKNCMYFLVTPFTVKYN